MIKKYYEYTNSIESDLLKLQEKYNSMSLNELIYNSMIYSIIDELELLSKDNTDEELAKKIDEFSLCLNNIKKAKDIIGDCYGNIKIFN